MPELRWTLLIIGVVFVAALAWWERRRPHQASRESVEMRPGPSDPPWGPESEPASPRILREPTLTLPEIRVRDPAGPLPVVEIVDDESLVGLRARHDEDMKATPEKMIADEPLTAEPPVVVPSITASPAPEILGKHETLPAAGAVPTLPARDPPPAVLMAPTRTAGEPPPAPHIVPTPTTREPPTARTPPSPEPPAPARDVRPVRELRPPPHRHTDAHEPAHDLPPGPSSEPIVEWPPEEHRKLLALRLVAPQPDRLSGRAVRQALAAEGFTLGKYGIFHKTDASNRVVVSAASLTKPGTFELETMDTQRFVGLNLFAVLPGPKSPLKAFDELLSTARTLNERLEGALQDERGGPLTPMRVVAIREALEAEAKS